LKFIPISAYKVEASWEQQFSDETKKMVLMLQKIYRKHGWPDLKRYQKNECLADIQKALIEHCPDMVGWRDFNEEEMKVWEARLQAFREEKVSKSLFARTDSLSLD
jgi:hypothetical protein